MDDRLNLSELLSLPDGSLTRSEVQWLVAECAGQRERAEAAEAENERLRTIIQKIGAVLSEAPDSTLKQALHGVFLSAIVERVLGPEAALAATEEPDG